LIVTEGFADLLRIRDQKRPELFARVAMREAGLKPDVWEVAGRIDARGNEVVPLDLERIHQIISAAKECGCEAMAVCLLNAYQNCSYEDTVCKALRAAGFRYVVSSAELRPFIHYLNRTETTVVDVTLGPVMEDYLGAIEKGLEKVRFGVMTSRGALVPRNRFRAMESLLSGPAGGVAGAAVEARQMGLKAAITFDMGGTSTDVARWAGDFDFQNLQTVGPARILSRSVRIETVAAGGGSICRVDQGRLLVGPESAGSEPGPACYGEGGPLTLTDVNFLLGRLDPKAFSIPLSKAASVAAAEVELARMPEGTSLCELLEGWLAVANMRMAQTIRQISVGEGYSPADHALIAFGGAGGMHACGVAKLLGMTTVVVPESAGLLSAVGIAESSPEASAERQLLKPLVELSASLGDLKFELEEEARGLLLRDGLPADSIVVKERSLDLRLQGQESTLTVAWKESVEAVSKGFEDRFVSIFGYKPKTATIEVVAARVRLCEREADRREEVFITDVEESLLQAETGDALRVFQRNELRPDKPVVGPALILDPFSTTYLEPGWVARVGSLGSLRIDFVPEMAEVRDTAGTALVQRELLLHRLYGLVKEMGEQLRRTALSTNIRERLDFSCALLDREGRLVVNAPHIPVHLGALGECVRAVMNDQSLQPGEVVVTNHPGFGGSHLPDITLLQGVFVEGELVAVLANRAHHAELGGKRPGSMPAEAKRLVEEGVVIRPHRLCEGDTVHWDVVEKLLREAPFPSRSPAENLADLHAQLASLRAGEAQFLKLVEAYGVESISSFFSESIEAAERALRACLKAMPPLNQVVEDSFDDGTPLKVSVSSNSDRVRIDFTGSSPVHPGNLNATPAIVRSAVLYVLRLLVDEPLPLNEGLLAPVEIVLPEGVLSPPFHGDEAMLPAVVGGNVETSQRIVDMLLEAFEICANGQGTMNNVLFGNDNFGYYETVGGGAGAAPDRAGGSGLHVHMTNTAITDAEVLEHRFPVRLWRFALRRDCGGVGQWNGGDGLERVYQWLEPLSVSLLTQRRAAGPRGMKGGGAGSAGSQERRRSDTEEWESVGGIESWDAAEGEYLRLRTPGGGAWGKMQS
jgi:5-oxoprolinase (ATP-hydrolysing)